jgi:dienelactone hydrolase
MNRRLALAELALFLVVGLFAGSSFAQDAPKDHPKDEPKEEPKNQPKKDNLICKFCDRPLSADKGACAECSKETASKTFKLCDECALKLVKCKVCQEDLPTICQMCSDVKLSEEKGKCTKCEAECASASLKLCPPCAVKGHLCQVCAKDAGNVKTASSKEVSFKTEDGVEIKGTLYSPRVKRGPGALLLHQIGKDRSSWKGLAAELQESGFAVLTMDFRGFGESVSKGKTKLDYTAFKDEDYKGLLKDIKSATDFLASQEEVDKDSIVLVGASIGANTAMYFAAKEPLVKALVLLSPGENYRGFKVKTKMMEYGARPILLIAAKDDEYSLDACIFLSQTAKGKKEFKQLFGW